ncbi:Protein kinase domain-containing protein 38 [Elsinoe fawcettii]|nr:Protein kinase domain-containing protein 38 [Elsinoe fawcettii]
MAFVPSQTQELTQKVLDPRRTGNNFSDLDSADIADIICILHPASDAALEIVARTARRQPKHVLQFNDFQEYCDDLNTAELNTQQTLILPENEPRVAMDLALRFSAPVKNVANGFIFGRNSNQCDLIFDTDTIRRVSNVHFRIFMNHQGVLMLHDTSTNGTLVDDVLLQGKPHIGVMQTRMLKSGSVLQILSSKPEEVIKFIVRIPQRNGFEKEYEDNFRSYMQEVALVEADSAAQAQAAYEKQMQAPQRPQRPGGVPTRVNTLPSTRHPLKRNDWGMHWNGGTKFNVVGHLGKGAFATVYQVATKADGILYAAKELEKRKFMKNGVLDRKLDNEMQIMKDLSHPNIVQYVEYHDHDKHLYIIMEFVGCGDLQQYIVNNGPLPDMMGKSMAVQVLTALSYLHTKRITHRDIKPDNILIANADPDNFWVKLSDFGLSKVVKDNDTFLKTFCGTLLYCAPEVFPHYDTHVAQHGGLKRQRRTAGNQKTYHSYSQSVDVWSFGAVLWYALCGKTPFEGVMDTNGKGMFDMIMHTMLDPSPLLQHGVSRQAIDLLFHMLNTNPADRPIPGQCLQHPWFAGLVDQTTEIPDTTELGAIDEAGESFEEKENDEPDLSQLRIDEGSLGAGEVSFDSSDLDFLNPRESKRFKQHKSRSQPSGSSGEDGQIRFEGMSQGQPRRPMLFGEVTGSMLNQQAHADAAPAGAIDQRSANSSGRMSTGFSNGAKPQIEQGRPDSFALSRHLGENSLSGAESMVRDLNMDSPQSADSPSGEANEPRTPDPPRGQHAASNSNGDMLEETPTKAQEMTPRPVPFSRQIQLDVPAAYWYDPNDPSTHNPEYASTQSGHDFLANPTVSSSNFDSFARVAAMAEGSHDQITQIAPKQEETSAGYLNEGSVGASSRRERRKDTVTEAPTLAPAATFALPPPRLGLLATTADSYEKIEIKLTGRMTTWGRAPGNTQVYDKVNDTRIPKAAIIIFFNAPGLTDEVEESGQDWTKFPELGCTIATQSRHGIHVNGKRLKKTDDKGRLLFGRLYHGDIITIVPGRKAKNGQDGTELAFRVEIYHGLGSKPRAEGDAFKIEIDQSISRA